VLSQTEVVVAVGRLVGPASFVPPARVTIVAGKGGVGKTTVAAALGRLAARTGYATLIIEVEGKSGLPALFGQSDPLSYQETVLLEAGAMGSESAEVRARTLLPDDALLEYLDDHGMRRISRRLVSSGTLDVVATAVPGIKDILVLGKVKQLESQSAAGWAGTPDFIVVDAPAAGHAVTFLASAYGLLDAAAVGPIRDQAVDVIGLLGDPARCQVLLVTVPEETPVNEAAETAFHLEDRTGVQLAPIVVNGLWAHLDLPEDPAAAVAAAGLPLAPAEVGRVVRAAEFRRQRQRLQEIQLARLADLLPLPQLRLPYVFTTELGPEEVDVLAVALGEQLAAVAP
jgi:anion-transporting  ArsA/GET3 family ATPase